MDYERTVRAARWMARNLPVQCPVDWQDLAQESALEQLRGRKSGDRADAGRAKAHSADREKSPERTQRPTASRYAGIEHTSAQYRWRGSGKIADAGPRALPNSVYEDVFLGWDE